MKLNAKWTVYLQPSWIYDVSVTMGSQDNSGYNLNVISDSGTYILARFFFPLNILFCFLSLNIYDFLS